MRPTVVLASQDLLLLELMAGKLQELFCTTILVCDDKDLLSIILERDVDVVLLDIRNKGHEKIQILSSIMKAKPATEIITLSNMESIQWAMEAMQIGAFDDLHEPFEVDSLQTKICRAWDHKTDFGNVQKNILGEFFEKTMMAATFAQAGEFKTARDIASAKKGSQKPNSNDT